MTNAERRMNEDSSGKGREKEKFDLGNGDIEPEEIRMLEEAGSGDNSVIPKTDREIDDFLYRNRRLIHAILRPYRGLDDYDDLYQEASIGFLQGLRTYNPKRGIKITTYAFACGRNQVKMYLRRGRAKSRTGITVSLEASYDPDNERDNLLNKDLNSFDPLHEPEDMDEAIHRGIEYARAERIMNKYLNETQRFVVRQMMRGIPQSKTAKILATSQSEISKILKTSICIIKLKMEEEEQSGWIID